MMAVHIVAFCGDGKGRGKGPQSVAIFFPPNKAGVDIS